MKQYFETPTQVLFKQDVNGAEWFAGIAHHDEIICGCCGGIVEVSETELIQPLPWVNISDAIAGDLPLNE